MKTPRSLVAGIGNVFLADDGFGVEVVRRLAERPLPGDVIVEDFGIRGLDLAYALMDGYAHVLLVDAVACGGEPGALYVFEPVLPRVEAEAPGGVSLEAHAFVPTQVLALVRAMGGTFRSLRVVGCEPERIPASDEILVGLSEPVAAAIDPAVALIEEMLGALHA